MSVTKKNILVSPLNWGLGHATRCIPIIAALENNGFTPILASDGPALEMLRKEFPHLLALELPSYRIKYAKKKAFFRLKLLWNSPKMIRAILKERKTISKWIAEYDIQGIISDNRLGVFDKKTPSVYITHQLTVLSGNTSYITTKLHQTIIKKYTECWIPDVPGNKNLTGKLGHSDFPYPNLKYIGPLSRLQKKTVPKKYDLMIMLSGPEPQRSILEAKLKGEVIQFDGKIIFIKGKVEATQQIEVSRNITYYNYMNSLEIETAFNESELVLSRPGYTTIMDLAQLQKKAFFIPTPGQYEQEYLAGKLKKEGLVPFAKQANFKIGNLLEVELYRGLQSFNHTMDWKNLFSVFDPKV